MNVPLWTMIKNGALQKFTVLELILMENMEIVAMTVNQVLFMVDLPQGTL